MSNSLDPHDFVLSPEELAGDNQESAQTREKTRGKPDEPHERIKWYRFPPWVLNNVLAAGDSPNNYHAVLAVLMALFELWYTGGHRGNPNPNPVKLTSAYVKRRFGLSRWQKRQALVLLEKAGVVIVEYQGRGQNPWVTLKWELLP